MSKALTPQAKSTKKSRPTSVNRIHTGVNPISPFMQKVRGLLNKDKPARQLAYLTGLSLSYCQKVLTGERPENFDLLVGLLRADFGREVLFAVADKAAWIHTYQDLLELNDLNRKILENEAAAKALSLRVAAR